MKSLSIVLALAFFLVLFPKSYAKESSPNPSEENVRENPVAIIELEKKFPASEAEASQKVEEVSRNGTEDDSDVAKTSSAEADATPAEENKLIKAKEILKDGILFALDKAQRIIKRCRPIDVIMWYSMGKIIR